eukprot:scaffold242072_cov15-Tisochrysis_lutea.AAC.2
MPLQILERRYPVVLRAFHLREGSGGNGQFKGGDGVVREKALNDPTLSGALLRSTASMNLSWPAGRMSEEMAQRTRKAKLFAGFGINHCLYALCQEQKSNISRRMQHLRGHSSHLHEKRKTTQA